MPLNTHKAETRQDTRTILYQGSKLENQHTRKTLGTLGWIYKPSDNPMPALLVGHISRETCAQLKP